MTATGAAAADDLGMVVPLEGISHVDEAGLMGTPQGVEGFFQRDLPNVSLFSLDLILRCVVDADANIQGCFTVPPSGSAVTVFEGDGIGLPQDRLHAAEVKDAVLSLDGHVDGYGHCGGNVLVDLLELLDGIVVLETFTLHPICKRHPLCSRVIYPLLGFSRASAGRRKRSFRLSL